MFKNVQTPTSFSFVEKGKTSFLLKEEYINLLLKQGIDDLKTFLKKSSQASHYVKGRTLHPSLPLEGEKRMVLRQWILIHGNLVSLGEIRIKIILSGKKTIRCNATRSG